MADRRMGAPVADNTPLTETLRLAVPLRIDELTRMPASRRAEVIGRWAADSAQMIAHHGDLLMFPTRARKRHTQECQARRGDGQQPNACGCRIGTAEVFNALARGLAAGAFLPGGVEFAGCRWQVDEGTLPVEPKGRPVVTVELPEVVGSDG